jgi:hypothetical protein
MLKLKTQMVRARLSLFNSPIQGHQAFRLDPLQDGKPETKHLIHTQDMGINQLSAQPWDLSSESCMWGCKKSHNREALERSWTLNQERPID